LILRRRKEDAVAEESLHELMGVWEGVRAAFTAPSFRLFITLAFGWVCTQGRHAVTQALVEAGVATSKHHEAFHRFFSRGTWSPDTVGYLLFMLVRSLVPLVQLVFSLDDTLCPKRGPHVFGIGSHRDAVLSSGRHKVLRFGHVWVVLAVVVYLPFCPRPFALPLLFRLYRTEKACQRNRHVYRTKNQLARQMLEVLLRWVPEGTVRVAMDGAYCNSSVVRGQPERLVFFGVMRPDACLTALPAARKPGQRGRTPLRGKRLPSPQQLARRRSGWQTLQLELYGQRRTLQVRALRAQWYGTAGSRLLHVVVVRQTGGRRTCRVFFCTQPDVDLVQLLQTYALRWPLEVTFRDLKQLLGFAHSSARLRTAVERTAPFVGLLYTTLVLWAARGGASVAHLLMPERPWNRHKVHLSFADILFAAQRVLGQHVADLPSILESLCPTPKGREIHPQPSAPSGGATPAAS
jgi:hypothetical protein